MQNRKLNRVLSVILCIALLAAAALMLTGCQKTPETSPSDQTAPSVQTEQPALSLPVSDGASLGQGQTQFSLTIADKAGAETHVTISTDEKTVGAALLSLGLIAGEEGQYGLYVKTVNGVTADYDEDGTYWAFYIGEDYASSGVDQTEIVPGAAYALRVGK